jgi:aryl-alcohol dehydrogenase-like predicted oxidoreductase
MTTVVIAAASVIDNDVSVRAVTARDHSSRARGVVGPTSTMIGAMQTRRFGKLGWPVSEVGYGLWGMGGWSGSDDAESIAALERAVERGCTFFDTALAYGDGKSEQLLGKVLARHRDKSLVVATKIPPKNRKWPAFPDYKLEDVFPADYVREATETSLKNLGVSQIDLQQFHVWTDAWANDERWQRAVDDLKREKLVRAFGISVNRWEPANVLKALRTGLVDSVQVVYNLFDQNPEDELFPLCRELGVAVIARVPFDEGSLTGTLTKDAHWPEGDWRNLYFTPENLAETLEHVDRVKPDVPSGMTLPELALRFILACPDVTTVIPGMRKARHVDANLGVSDGRALDPALLERLRRHRWVRTHVIV